MKIIKIIKTAAEIESALLERWKRIKAQIANFTPVEGVTYRTSPTTGLKRPVKPKPIKGQPAQNAESN